MFWPIALPFKITFYTMLAIIVVATLAAPLVSIRRSIAFFTISGLAIVCFIPACTAVMNSIDATRFGEFQYADTRAIGDQHAAMYLPPNATKIRTLQQPNGIWATFHLDEPTLIAYIQSRWDSWGNSAVNRGEDWQLESVRLLEERNIKFRDIDWDLPDPDVTFVGPTAADGAGFQIWYDRDSQTGMLWGCYW